MSVVVMIGGKPFTGWTEVSVSIEFDKAANEGTVTLTEQPQDPFPAKLNDPAVILVDGTPVVTGFVDDVDGEHDFGSHYIKVTIRDKTQDIVDSTIGPKQSHKPPIGLADVCRKTIAKMGINCGVIDKVGPPNFRPSEYVSGEIDTFGHDFLNRWANKRQVVLNTDGKGNLCIDRNQKRLGPGRLMKSFEDSPTNNVLKAHYSNSTKGRANKHSSAGQKSNTDRYWEGRPKSDPKAQAGPISKNIGEAYDGAIRKTRRIYYPGQQAIEGDTPKGAAAWKANLSRADAVKYSATVQGFSMGGALWWPGYIIPVRDDHFLLASMMFIKSVRFRASWSDGEQTELSLTVKDAYTKDASAQTTGDTRGTKNGIGWSAPTRFSLDQQPEE